MPEADFIPGLDTTALTSVSGAQLYSLIRDALPEDNRGGVIYSATTPDVVTNPHLVRYIWVDLNGKNADSQPPFVARVWNTVTSGWDPLTIALATVTGDDIEDSSIDPVAKLSAAGLADDLILMTNAEDWQVISLIDGIAAGSLPLTKLLPGSAGQYLFDNGTVRMWKEITFGELNVGDGIIPTEKLGRPIDETHILAGDPDDSLNVKWRAFSDVVTRALVLTLFATNRFPWSHIGKAGANQLPIMDSEGVDWGFINRAALEQQPLTVEKLSVNLNDLVVTYGMFHEIAHSLGAVPDIIDVRLKCVDAANPHGYELNEEMSLDIIRNQLSDSHGILMFGANASVVSLQTFDYFDFEIKRKNAAVFDLMVLYNSWQYFELYVRIYKLPA